MKFSPLRQNPINRAIWSDTACSERLGHKVHRTFGSTVISHGLLPIPLYVLAWANTYLHLAPPIEKDAVVSKHFGAQQSLHDKQHCSSPNGRPPSRS